MSAGLPSQEVLLRLLRYDPETGKLYWRDRAATDFPATGRGGSAANAKRWNAQWAGKEALTAITATGRYYKGRVLLQNVAAHRVIFKMLHGYDPVQVDHDNGDGLDNRPRNLIDRSNRDNNRNRAIPSTNRSGIMGVCRNEARGKWIAYVRGDDNKIIHLGYFSNLEDAAAARAKAVRERGYNPNHGRKAAADEMPSKMRRFLAKPARKPIIGRARSYPKTWLKQRLKEQKSKCFYCCRRIKTKPLPEEWDRKATIDHVVPLSRGGENKFRNVVAACTKCNSAKGSLSADEFREQLSVAA